MKVAVSIPDPVFAEAELLAKQLNTSRSDVYARALREFVAARASERLTRAINESLMPDEGLDEFGCAAARRVFERNEW